MKKFDGSAHGGGLGAGIRYNVWLDSEGEGAMLFMGTDDPYDEQGFTIYLEDVEEGLRGLAEVFTNAADYYKENKRLEEENASKKEDTRKST